MPSNAPTIHVSIPELRFGDKTLFKNFRCQFTAGQFSCLLGASGAGKTTLLKLLAATLTAPDADITDEQGQSIASQVSYMAQADLLLPWLSVMDNVLIGYKLRGSKLSRDIKEQASTLIQQVGLHAATNQKPQQLSGGMRQRVALARTLMEQKPIILMDEPFAALDAVTRYHMQTLAMDILRDKTVILITHDPQEALRLGQQIYVLTGQPARLESPVKGQDQAADYQHLMAQLSEGIC